MTPLAWETAYLQDMRASLAPARLLAFVACVGGAGLLPLAGTEAPPRVSRPKLQVLEPEPRFTVTEGDVVTHVFRIRNVGDAPLVITDIKTSGGVEWTGPDGVTVTIRGQFVGWDGQSR